MKVIQELRHEYRISILLKVSGVKRSTYYYHYKNMNKPDKYAIIKEKIKKIFYDDNKCRRGYRPVTSELRKEYKINYKTVYKLMKTMGLYCMVRAKKYSPYKVGLANETSPNLLNRDFKATRLNEKWVTDVTEFNLFGKKLYLSTILDLYNSEIISYTICHRPRLTLVTDMLNQAIKRIPDNHQPIMLHSDQGWHYRTTQYRRILRANSITQSMSRKATCLDNAVMENFFGILKTELLYLQKFKSYEHFIEELHLYINYYNNKRTKLKLNGLSPVEFRSLAA